jgi:transposase
LRKAFIILLDFLPFVLWAHKYGTVRDVAREVGVNKEAVAHHYVRFRNICRAYFRRHPIRLGGPGIHVFVDEHFMSVRKNMRGRRVRRRTRWIFGGVEEGSGHSFMVPVLRRRAIDLLPNIQRYILPASIVVTDEWRAYRQIRIMQHRALMYRHLTVNHRHYFVDPATGIHTQRIENKWGQWKSEVRRIKGVSDRQLRSKIAEFLWHERFGDHSFYNFWLHVSGQYPVDR